MDFLLIALGSHGDVHPFVGIGRGLFSRGHRVRVAANEHFKKLVENAGLEFVQAGDEALFNRMKNDPDVWHVSKGPQRVMEFVAKTIDQVYDMVLREATLETRIVGSSLSLGARCAQEKFGYKLTTVHLAPICIRSIEHMPALPGGLIDLNWFPHFVRRGFWRFADWLLIEPMIRPELNAFRDKHGLPPVRGIVGQWWNSPTLTIGMWPEWFFPIQPDYPRQVKLAGFPLYDESDHVSLDPELESFLQSGPPPIAFTPGSAMLFGHKFFEAAVDACVRMNRRGILLSRHPDHIPANLPETIKYVPFAPFGVLLPRCSAVVHHGGIGSTAQGFNSGIPQLIMPMSHDQFDNAAIAKRIGVADFLSVRAFKGRNVASKLEQLIQSDEALQKCQQIQQQIRSENAVEKCCRLLESVA